MKTKIELTNNILQILLKLHLYNPIYIHKIINEILEYKL